MTGRKVDIMPNERIAELCKPAMTKRDLAKAIIDDCGCARQSAYRYILKATGKTIKMGKDETYFKR